MIKNFIVEGLIKEAYKFAYKSLLEDENYLRLNSTENLLLSYISVLIRRKDKKKELLLVFLPLIIPKELKNLIPPILPLYNNTSDIS